MKGMQSQGQKNIVNLLRCAWAGSQKYGALVWSGDIASTFESMRNQLTAGLNMAIAGIPWWTTDIGGFHGGDPNKEDFRELFARWFQWGTFCPVMRFMEIESQDNHKLEVVAVRNVVQVDQMKFGVMEKKYMKFVENILT